MTYLNDFLSLNCASDILKIVQPIQGIEKEISEAMAVRKQIKDIVLNESNPNKQYIYIDFCSGNALIPVLSAFTFPSIEISIAIDKRERKRNWDTVRRFKYRNLDIYKIDSSIYDNPYPLIITACHACKGLAEQVVKIYNTCSEEKHLILMPCCEGKQDYKSIPELVRNKLGNYLSWSYQLFNQVNSTNKKLIQDKKVLSPKNIMVIANG